MTTRLYEEGTLEPGPVIVMVGRQGSGKGTQGARLADRLGLTHLSTGDVLRAAVAGGTVIGRQVERTLAAGELVGDDVMVDLVSRRLAAGRSGVVLDGFPRTVRQCEALAPDGDVGLAVQLVISTKVAMERLLARRYCERCGTTTSRLEERCEACGGRLVRRSDDTREAIERRLSLFDEQTRPVLSWFAERGRLVQVDGNLDADTVADRLFSAIASRPELASLLAPST